MPSQTLQFGQVAAFPVSGKDASNNPEPVHGTASIDDPTKGWVQAFPPSAGKGMGVVLVPRVQAPQGGSYTITATLTLFAADGSALPPVSCDATLMGPPAPPPATAVVIGTPVVVPPGNTDYGDIVAPGAATVTL